MEHSWLQKARSVAQDALSNVQRQIGATMHGGREAAADLARWLRSGSSIKARYEGAVAQPYRSRLNASLQDARYDQKPCTRETLQKKARYFERNSALVNRLADLFELYVVGQGIQFFANSDDPEWNQAANEYWNDWKPFADILTRQNFDCLQGVIARALWIDGEIFVLLTRGTAGRPRIQLIEAHRCKTPPDRIAEEGRTIVDGVAINEIGRPTGYWFIEDNFSGTSDPPMGFNTPSAAPPATFRLVDAINVVHIFEPSRAGQFRGLPMLYPVMNDLHDLDDLQLLEMKAARDAAEVSNVITTAAGELTIGDLNASGGAIAASADPAQKQCYYQDTIGGRTLVLQNGDSIQQFRSTRPEVATREYWVGLEHKVCAGTGIARQLVYPESIQGTVERSVLDMQNSWFMVRCSVLAGSFIRIREYVLSIGSSTELRLSDPPANWRAVSWRGPRAVNVDVGRQSQAMLNELAAGVRTREGIWAEVGRDWKIETRQKAAEEKYLDSLAAEFGLPVERIAASALPPAAPPQPEDEPVPVPSR
jgi:lambda family phage portal protein